MRTRSEPRPDPTEHAPTCTNPGYMWQAVIVPNLPRIGRCKECGAVTKTSRFA